MLELCRLILVWKIFWRNYISAGGMGELGSGEKLRSESGSFPHCLIANYGPGPNLMPLRGWRIVGLGFLSHSKVVY